MSSAAVVRTGLLAAALALGACSSAADKPPAPDPERTGGAGGSGRGGAPVGSGGAGGGSVASGGAGVGVDGGNNAPTPASGGSGAVDSAPAIEVPLPECNHPAWMAGKAYKTGDIVMYMGKPYVAKADNPGYDPIISTFFWEPFAGCVPPPPAEAVKCPALDAVLPEGEKTFTEMFKAPFMGQIVLPVYSYDSLCKALMSPVANGFAASGNATNDKRELAAFFANVAIETAYLTAIDEKGHRASDGTHHGRGALQLTGQANYSAAGAALGLNLAGMPQLGSTPVVVWQTGLWYWMRNANPSVPAPQICHQAIQGGDFGKTVRIIKGNCVSNNDRAAQYRKNCTLLGVDPGKTTCP